MNDVLRNKSILLFDGYCNLCQSSVQFILKHEKNNELYFTSLQSKVGQEILAYYKIDRGITDSLVLIKNNKAYIKSTAAIMLSHYFKGIYRCAIILKIIPRYLRDKIYDYIAKNRYKWYGKQTQCIVPDKQLALRFL